MNDGERSDQGEAPPEPLVRARHVKSTLAFSDELPEGPLVREATPPRIVEAIDRASGMDWLPVGHDVALTRALFTVLGPSRHATFCTDHVLRSFQGPILRPIAEAAVRLLGRDLASMARWIPKGWWLVFRDCGSWITEPMNGTGEIWLRYAGVPEACLAERAWMKAVGHSMSAVPVLAGFPGRITLEQLDPAAREARYVLRWTR